MNNRPQTMSAASEDRIEAFESQLATVGEADLREFVPAADDPEYLSVLQELVRIHLEFQFAAEKDADLNEYLREFPELRECSDVLTALAFEEYRLRRQAGLAGSASELAARYGVTFESWRQLPEDSAGDPHFEPPSLSPGDSLLDFRIVGQLGRGAFARVYLARQKSLSDRLVVVKLSNAKLPEARLLAKLQHTNIVPIYSVHHVGQMSVICMPWFGATTLRHVIEGMSGRSRSVPSGVEMLSTVTAFDSRTLRSFQLRPDSEPSIPDADVAATESERRPSSALAGLNHEHACLWLIGRVADGLSHAHQRGILHRDLKPANILLTEDGQPMVLDFNLSSDRSSTQPNDLIVGGTLPYMSPEQLDSVETLRQVDAQSDVYSLGVILFEMLYGRLPFRVISTQVRKMITERTETPINYDQQLSRVSPGTISILKRCLASQRQDRYQTVDELLHDLECHLQSLPLKHAPNPSLVERLQKWTRRHPSLTSVTAICMAAMIAITVLGLVLYRANSQLKASEARQTFDRFMAEAPRVRSAALATVLGDVGKDEASSSIHDLIESIDSPKSSETLTGVLTNLEEPHRTTLSTTLEELRALQSLLQGQRSAAVGDTPLDAQATIPSQTTATAEYHQAISLLMGHEYTAAEASLRELVRKDPGNFTAAFLYGLAQRGCLRPEMAEDHFSACIALRPDLAQSWYQRGVCRLAMKDYSGAAEDFTEALRIEPRNPAALFSRALAVRELPNGVSAAIADLTASIEAGFRETRVYFVRAALHQSAGNVDEAEKDRQLGISLTPEDARSWIARALQKLPDHPQDALADIEAAAKLEPDSHDAYRNRAMVLSEHLHRSEDAIEVLNAALSKYPEDPYLWSGRAVLYARGKNSANALSDIQSALQRSDDPMVMYQAACVFALLSTEDSQHRTEAIRCLQNACEAQSEIARVAFRDPDMQSLKDDLQFKRILAAAEILMKE